MSDGPTRLARIEEAQIIRLSIEDQRNFAEAIFNPAPLTPAMERAIERYRKVIAARGDRGLTSKAQASPAIGRVFPESARRARVSP
jgi:hypothetical protein